MAVGINYDYAQKNLKKYHQKKEKGVKNLIKNVQKYQVGKKSLLNEEQLKKLSKELDSKPKDGGI
ncbi:MAG: hypothetical protein WBA93_11805 [Microcoleaceae cyanobacterium]